VVPPWNLEADVRPVQVADTATAAKEKECPNCKILMKTVTLTGEPWWLCNKCGQWWNFVKEDK